MPGEIGIEEWKRLAELIDGQPSLLKDGLQCFRLEDYPAMSGDRHGKMRVTRAKANVASRCPNFAKTGNPNGAGLPQWPRFDASARGYIEFTDNGPQAREGLRRPYCDLYIENVKRLMAH